MSKNVIIAASLPAVPERLFDMYLDRELHAAFTGARSKSPRGPGRRFMRSTAC